MSKRVVRILAVVALVFMALFTASMIAWCFDRTLFNGSIGYVCIFTGGIGIGVYVVLMLVKRAEARAAREREQTDDTASDPTAAASDETAKAEEEPSVSDPDADGAGRTGDGRT